LNYLIPKILLFLLSFCLIVVTPVLAQQTTINLPEFAIDDVPVFSRFRLEEDNAPVILDGRQLFQVGGFVSSDNPLTANKRAEEINKKLESAVRANISPEIEIKNSNGLPTIFLNNRYLFTVTTKETIEGETLVDKAINLQNKLEKSIIKAQAERAKEYQLRQYIIASIALAIALTINRFLNFLKRYPVGTAWQLLIPFSKNKSYLKSPELTEQESSSIPQQEQSLTFLSKLKLGLAKTILWLAIAYLLTDLFPATRQLRYEIIDRLWKALNSPLFSITDNNYSIISVLILIGLFWGLVLLIKTLTNLLKNNILLRTSMSRGSQEVIFIITQYGLLFFGTIILLQIWGLNLSSLTILGSAFGVGIGFGFQDIAKNFASGLVLLFERSVQVGDFIEVNGYKGIVERVGARSIVLRTLDRISIIVPNSSLLAGEVINWTHESSISRLHLPVGVAYGSDTEVVKSLLLEAAATHPEVLRHPAPQVLFDGFGDSSLDFKLLIWISEPSHQIIIKSDLYFKIEHLLRDRNIEVPFPHRDIQFRNPKLSFGLSEEIEAALLKWFEQSSKSDR
jgi:potassium-dependent mechanosensitive channel